MNATTWLFITNASVWCGIGLYLLFIGLCQKTLRDRVKQLESLRDGDD